MNPSVICRLFLTAILTAIGAISLPGTQPARPPNVVVFLADDAGWGDYSINGNQTVRTPNIDSIGLGGARFDRFFVCAVCAPTRAEFLTGRYHSREIGRAHV